MYTQKTIDLVGEYISLFPELIHVLSRTDSIKDTFKSEDMFVDPKLRYILLFQSISTNIINIICNYTHRQQRLDDLKKWLGEMRLLTKDKQTCGSMEPCKVATIEKYMDKFINENHKYKKTMTLSVKSQNLFKVNF